MMPSSADETTTTPPSDDRPKPIPAKRIRFPRGDDEPNDLDLDDENSGRGLLSTDRIIKVENDDDDEEIPPPVPPRRESKYSPAKRKSRNRDDGELDELTKELNASLTDAGNRIVTITGTIKRGSKHGQAVEVQLKLSETELRRLSTVVAADNTTARNRRTYCGLGAGIHILLLSALCSPVAFVISAAVAFYTGTMTWYNFYLYFSEERSLCHKILVCPLLIIFYPALIVAAVVALGIYGAVAQVSWFYASWSREMRDPEKGFYGWLCAKMNLGDLTPYEVVVLDEDAAVAPSGVKQREHAVQEIVDEESEEQSSV
ncbi:transmembrane protein 169-like [Tubulanus polymorphus]|uniref:transmembrane protein 169-like n=1 Tax=Tubulanus polymorphus TaxID=672921 RepID=UPI003DA1FAD2